MIYQLLILGLSALAGITLVASISPDLWLAGAFFGVSAGSLLLSEVDR